MSLIEELKRGARAELALEKVLDAMDYDRSAMSPADYHERVEEVLPELRERLAASECYVGVVKSKEALERLIWVIAGETHPATEPVLRLLRHYMSVLEGYAEDMKATLRSGN
ncbi:MAG: hypothetical protein AAF654_15245 [Myxococcota bacterium]